MFEKVVNFLTGPSLQDILDHAGKNPEFTPDKFMLQQFARTYLFEYGDAMQGMPRHHLIADDCLAVVGNGEAYTRDRYSLWKRNEGRGTFPVAGRINLAHRQFPRARIRGEALLIKTEALEVLDRYRRNTVEFVRKRVQLMLPQMTNEGTPVQITAWMYVGKNETWRKDMEWDASFYRNQKKGYQFSPVSTYPDTRTWFNRYAHFTIKEFTTEKTPKCFIGLRNGNSIPDPVPEKLSATPEMKLIQPPRELDRISVTSDVEGFVSDERANPEQATLPGVPVK